MDPRTAAIYDALFAARAAAPPLPFAVGTAPPPPPPPPPPVPPRRRPVTVACRPDLPAAYDAVLAPTPPPPTWPDDAIVAFTRAKLREEGFFRLICPAIPVGAPWWETGWSIATVLRHARSERDDRDDLAARRMTRDRWRAYDGRRRRDLRTPPADPLTPKLAASLAVLGRLAAQIRALGDRP